MTDEVDRILDAALECYSSQEPRPGLPGRVLARVRSDTGVARRRWFGFVFAIAAAACLAVGLVVWRLTPPPLTLSLAPPPPPAVPELRVSVSPPVRVRRSPVREQRPLVALTSIPPEAALWLADADRPLEVKPLEIKPLQIDSIETGELK
jgi:hypothetical protein